MSDRDPDDSIPTERQTPVGEPVIRGDPSLTGQRAREAVQFDPDDEASLDRAAAAAARFAAQTAGHGDNVAMLRGAAACAALVRGEGSYTAAAERAGEDVTVSFVRKWSRVHDLPKPIRAHVAKGDIAPSAAKHIARVSGRDRFRVAWAVIDHDMTVRDVRTVVSQVDDGLNVVDALEQQGITLGELSVELPEEQYTDLRRRVALAEQKPGDVIASELADRFGVE
ncbi:hypothetical protein BRD19_05765 [Halobacteriales archaeon SW_7_65_23]|jgi:hypothetical protein|nr:MAG: hypothetical protein BRD19_05765 [Halobacteriales archaeon SW_7_65_23]